MMLAEMSGDHKVIHPEGMKVCTKFHGNRFDSCWDISLWTKVLNWLTDPPPSWQKSQYFQMILSSLINILVRAFRWALTSKVIHKRLYFSTDHHWVNNKTLQCHFPHIKNFTQPFEIHSEGPGQVESARLTLINSPSQVTPFYGPLALTCPL